MHDLLAILLGLFTGATMAVAVSCAWCVLHLPARLQDRLRAGSARLYAWAIVIGCTLSALRVGADLSLGLPPIAACPVFLAGGMFVGMLAAALEEILEVAPVLMRRMRLGNVSPGLRFTLLIAKGLGAIVACLIFTL